MPCHHHPQRPAAPAPRALLPAATQAGGPLLRHRSFGALPRVEANGVVGGVEEEPASSSQSQSQRQKDNAMDKAAEKRVLG